MAAIRVEPQLAEDSLIGSLVPKPEVALTRCVLDNGAMPILMRPLNAFSDAMIEDRHIVGLDGLQTFVAMDGERIVGHVNLKGDGLKLLNLSRARL